MTPPTDERTRTIELPERIAQTIAVRLEGTEFDSVDDYVAFSVEQLLRELDQTDGDPQQVADATLADGDADEQEEAVQERLESLGYL